MITISHPSSKNRQRAENHPASKTDPASRVERGPMGRSAAGIAPAAAARRAALPCSRFLRTRTKLRGLSNDRLLSDLEDLNGRERKLQALLLLYLAELETRRLHLPLGYGSLFDFCTHRLGYTRATAARRIRAARAAARYPEALEMLVAGEINITTLSMISDLLEEDTHRELLDSIKHKSTRQVECLVAAQRPVRAIRDTVRPICVKRRVEVAPPAGGGAVVDQGDLSGKKRCKCNKLSSSAETNPGNRGCIDGEDPTATGSRSTLGVETDPGAHAPEQRRKCNKLSSSAETRVVLEQRLKLGFTVSPEFMAKYDKIKSLLSGRHPEGISFERLFELLMDEYLERHDPERRQARRAERAKQRSNAPKRGKEKKSARTAEKSMKQKGIQRSRRNGAEREPKRARGKHRNAAEGARKRGAPEQPVRDAGFEPLRSRHIPPAIRDRVYARDGGRCAFVGAGGRRCGSTWDLEIDHIVPLARGGESSPGNLRLLCRKHNIYQAERAYGREFMKEKKAE